MQKEGEKGEDGEMLRFQRTGAFVPCRSLRDRSFKKELASRIDKVKVVAVFMFSLASPGAEVEISKIKTG